MDSDSQAIQPVYNLKSNAWLNRLFQETGVGSAVTHEEKSLVGECRSMSYMENEPKMVVSQTFECEPFAQIQDHIRSGAGDTVNVSNLRPPEVLDKTMHYLVHAHMRNPRDTHWYTLSMQQFNYIGDRFRRIRTQWAPQFLTTTVKSKEECSTVEEEKYAYDSNRRKRWLEFMARTLLAYNGLCTRSPELCAEHLPQKQQILEALKDTFGTLIHYYRMEQRYRSSEMVSIIVLFYGLHQLKKVESCENWCRFDENTGEFEHPMKGVDLKEVYAELGFFPHVAMTSHVQDALELMHSIQQRQWFRFFSLCRSKPLTFGQKCCLTNSFTYVRFRAIVDLCTVSQSIGKQARVRGSVPILELTEGLMFDGEEHCIEFLQGLGLGNQVQPKVVDGVEVLSLILTSDKNELLTTAMSLNRNASGRGQEMPRIGVYFPPDRKFLGLEDCVVTELVGTPLKFATDETSEFTDDVALVTTPINVMKFLEPHCPSYNERVAAVQLMPLQYPGRQEGVSEDYFNEIVTMRRRAAAQEHEDEADVADEDAFNESESDEAATASVMSGGGHCANQTAFEFLLAKNCTTPTATSTLGSAIQDTLAQEGDANDEDPAASPGEDAEAEAKAKAAKVVDAAIDRMMDDHKQVMSSLTCQDIYESYFQEQRVTKLAQEQKQVLSAEESKRSATEKEELQLRIKFLQQMKSEGESAALRAERMQKLKVLQQQDEERKKAAEKKATATKATADASVKIAAMVSTPTTASAPSLGNKQTLETPSSDADLFHEIPDEFPPTPPETPEVVVVPAPTSDLPPKMALALPPKSATLPPGQYPKIEPLSPSTTPMEPVKKTTGVALSAKVTSPPAVIVLAPPVVVDKLPSPLEKNAIRAASPKIATPEGSAKGAHLAPPSATPKRDATMLPPKHATPPNRSTSEHPDGLCVSPRPKAQEQRSYRELLRAAGNIARKEKDARRVGSHAPAATAHTASASSVACKAQKLTPVNWWSLADELLSQFFERQRMVSEAGLTDDITSSIYSAKMTRNEKHGLVAKAVNKHCFSITDSTVENVRESGTIELLSLPTLSFYLLVVGEFGSSSFANQRGVTTRSSSCAIGSVLRSQQLFPDANEAVASGDVLQSQHRQHFASDNGARPAFNAHVAAYSMDHDDVEASSLTAAKTSEDECEPQKKASAVVVLIAENVPGGYERAMQSLETLLSHEESSPAYVSGLIIAGEEPEDIEGLEAAATKLWMGRNKEAVVGSKRMHDGRETTDIRLASRSRHDGRKSFFNRDDSIAGSASATSDAPTRPFKVQHTPPLITAIPLRELYTKGISVSAALTEALKLVMVKTSECALEMTTPRGILDGQRGNF